MKKLLKHENIEEYIVNTEVKNGTKNIWLVTFQQWLEFHGINKEFKMFTSENSLPYVPLEKDLDQFIAGFEGSKYCSLLQLLKETGRRMIELTRLTPLDFDLERKTVTVNQPAKNGLAHQYKISDKMVAMITPLLRKTKPNERIWNTRIQAIKHQIRRKKHELAQKLGNPNLARISPKSFRHFVGTILYHKTKDILYVKEQLGHKQIKSTMVYTHLVNFESDEWSSAVATTVEETCKLVDNGFEFVCDFEGKKIFKKRK